MNFKQYAIHGTIAGTVFVAIIFVLIAFFKLICCRKQKWSEGNLVPNNKKWKRIEYLSKNEDTRPLAIINACSLLDQALKTQGYLGETLSERLIAAQIAIGNSQISNVLRLRNELVHNVDMKPLDKKKTKVDLKIIRQALFDLNVSV